MALSTQQEIAALKNKLAALEQRIVEESEASLEFELTFRYKTYARHWGSGADVAELTRHVNEHKPQIAEVLNFMDEGEEFHLIKVMRAV
jgi:pterin-4a-carbinolamine dehydratase